MAAGLITHTRGEHEDEERERKKEKARARERERERDREPWKLADTYRRRMHGRVSAREGQGDGVAQTAQGRGSKELCLSLSPSIHRRRNQSGGGGDGEKREPVYNGTRKGAFII